MSNWEWSAVALAVTLSECSLCSPSENRLPPTRLRGILGSMGQSSSKEGDSPFFHLSTRSTRMGLTR